MAIQKCKECGKEVSSQAKQCPHCGAPVKKGRGFISSLARLFVIVFVIIPVGIAIFGAVYQSETGARSSTGTPATNPVAAPVVQTPPLEVQSWRCVKEHGYMHVRGEVKNVSSGKLENVLAVGELRTKSGELVKTVDALIDYNPLMAGQTSPFSAGGTDNPEIASCQLAFKHLLGGRSVEYVEKKKGK